MKIIADPAIMYNLQVYFRENILPQLDNDDRVWTTNFKLWLLEQGAAIEHHPGRLLRNSLGIAPHYDALAFENEQDATVFVLRWT